uniref:Putative oxidoreductase n=1 Tax=Pithovirus LCPAC403 TaxID=2506596 RepID=A0A481ZD11_9VIRU|nr:MAG: putative oxidoreductase [Pithovirus LCPAC403]
MSTKNDINICPSYNAKFMESFKKDGYVVIKGLYSLEEMKRVETSIIKDVDEIVFGGEGKLDDYESLLVFTDSKRTKTTWRNGNSRQPLLSKSCGQISIHYNQDIIDTIQLDERPYKVMSKLYRTKYLVHTQGLEKLGLKIKGSTNMNKHIDTNLWYDEVNYPKRVQSFICVQCPDDVKPKVAGGLELLVGFDEYWDFASYLFHPKTGLFPMPDCKSRFQVLPKDFDINYLPKLIECAKLYRENINNFDSPLFVNWRKEGVTVGNCELKWTPIVCEPGDMVCWSQRVCHRNLRNTSMTPRIVVYYSLFPVDKHYYGSQAHAWLRKMIESGEHYYSVNAGKYPTKITNPEEVKLGKKALIKTDLGKKLVGEVPWFKLRSVFSRK